LTPLMSHADNVGGKLSFVESCVADLRRLARPERIEHDLREERFIEHTLQIAMQAALDVASRIAADQGLGAHTGGRGLFALLVEADWVEAELGVALDELAEVRDMLVYDYLSIDIRRVQWCLEHHVHDLVAYVAAVRRRLSESGQ
jgi:uncharacterized protein YutE (UPF0331/DUF86 family)